jgi:glycolate dehydrogenase iron-sulfur subunit
VDRELVRECVHCGFCLPTCPTWVLWSEEMDSPRGRIYLMEGLLDGTVELTPTVVQHFDRCLGCMACVTACPSGVKYDRLIELTRDHVERSVERPRAERLLRRLVFGVFPYPRRMRAALALEPLGRRLPVPGLLQPLLEVAPPWRSRERPPPLTTARGERIARVGLVTGCVQRVVFGNVNAATARVLAADGCEVVAPRRQGCCGALSVHAGRLEEGLARARKLIDVFERSGVDAVVTNAAGCGSNIRDYVHLLADDPRYAERAAAFSQKVRDVSEVLATNGPRAERHPLPVRVAFQDSCHLLHAQRVRSAPREALTAVPGLELAEPAEQELCCGSAGIYNLVQPTAARELGERKAQNVLMTNPDVYASGNPGCLIQVTAALRRAGRPLPAFHPIELVDASVRRVEADALLSAGRR